MNRQMRPRPLPRISCRRRSATRSASQCEALLIPPQGDLLLRRHKTRNIVWHQHAVAPIAQFNARDQLGFHGAAPCMGAGSLVVIMIGDATDEPEAHPAIRKEFKCLRRTRDKRGQPSLVYSA